MERGVGGQYFGRRQTQLCTLRMYVHVLCGLRSPKVNIYIFFGVDVPGGEQVPELHGEAGGGGGGHLRGCRGGAATAGHGGGTGEVHRLHCTKVDLFKVKIRKRNFSPLFVAFLKAVLIVHP